MSVEGGPPRVVFKKRNIFLSGCVVCTLGVQILNGYMSHTFWVRKMKYLGTRFTQTCPSLALFPLRSDICTMQLGTCRRPNQLWAAVREVYKYFALKLPFQSRFVKNTLSLESRHLRMVRRMANANIQLGCWSPSHSWKRYLCCL